MSMSTRVNNSQKKEYQRITSLLNKTNSLQMEHQSTQNTSSKFADAAVNQAFGDRIQTAEQFKDTFIWIVSQGNRSVATIDKQAIYQAEDVRNDITGEIEITSAELVEQELEQPTWNTILRAAAVIAERVYNTMVAEAVRNTLSNLQNTENNA